VVISDCTGATATPPTPTTTDNCKGIVSGTTTTPFPITTLGTNVVTWTFADGNGNVTTANQKVIVNGLTFSGFYSPVGGTGGTCASPLLTAKQGSNVPTKFDFGCGTTTITTGTAPIVTIQSYSASCNPGDVLVVHNAEYQNDWHYNWDTAIVPRGTYKITVQLPDGTSQFYFVKLK